MDAPPKRYDDAQVGRILRRAAELQASDGESDGPGMSLAEVEAVAREAGIEAALVHRAAGELSRPEVQPSPRPSRPLLGGPIELHFEARLPGKLSSQGCERLLHELRTRLDDPGRESRATGSLAWHASQDHSRRLSVTLTELADETVIRIDEKLQPLVGGLYGGLLGGLGGGGLGLIALPIVFAPWATPLVVVGWLGGVFGLTRAIYRRQVERREVELRDLLARLLEIGAASRARALPAASEAP